MHDFTCKLILTLTDQDTNVLGFKGPRKMKVVIPAMSIDKERLSVKPRKVSCTAHFSYSQCVQLGWPAFPFLHLLAKSTKIIGHLIHLSNLGK